MGTSGGTVGDRGDRQPPWCGPASGAMRSRRVRV